MAPAPITPAIQTVSQSHQFSDLEKVLLFVVLAVFVGGGFAAWRIGAWVAGNLRELVTKLVTELGELRSALLSSESSHAARVAEVKTEVAAVGHSVKEIGTKIDTLGDEIGKRISGVDDSISQTRLDLARSTVIPAKPSLHAVSGR